MMSMPKIIFCEGHPWFPFTVLRKQITILSGNILTNHESNKYGLPNIIYINKYKNFVYPLPNSSSDLCKFNCFQLFSIEDYESENITLEEINTYLAFK